MKPKNIVIISRVIFPSQSPRSQRATELAKELAKMGYNVTLYAVLGKYDYSKFMKETNIIVKNIGKTIGNNTNSDGISKETFINKIINYTIGKFIAYSEIGLTLKVKQLIKKELKFDYLITIAKPYAIHWGAALSFSNQHNKRFKLWVADCGDPYMGNPFARPPFYFKYIEKWWCRKVDFISIPIENAKKAYYKEFQNKIQVIPQGFNFSNIKICDYKPNMIPTFAYSGIVYIGLRDPSAFLEYLCSLKDINFKFIVYTKSINIFEKYKKTLGSKLEIYNYIPRRNLLEKLSTMDFLLNIKNESTVQAPSKLIDYSFTKRPILEISSTLLLEEKKIFKEFIYGNYTHKIKPLDIEKYKISTIANKFISLFK